MPGWLSSLVAWRSSPNDTIRPMSGVIVALIAGLGVAAYVWSMLAKSTGNARPSNTLVGAGIAGLVVFLVVLSVIKLVLNF